MATPSTPAFLKPQDLDTVERPSEANSSAAVEKTRKRFPRWVFFALLGLVLIAAGGFLFWRYRRNTHSDRNGAVPNSAASVVAAKTATPVPTIDLPLDPFVVNLADAGGHSYARIGLTLQLVALAATGKSEKQAATGDASGPRDMVRDTVITVLNQEQSTDLLAPGGKEHLKQAIKAAVTARDPQVKIADIYFTEFLVQQ